MQPMSKPKPAYVPPGSSGGSSSGSGRGDSAGGAGDRELAALVAYFVHQLAVIGKDESIEATDRIEIVRDSEARRVEVRCRTGRGADFVRILPMVARPPGIKCECCDGTGRTPGS